MPPRSADSPPPTPNRCHGDPLSRPSRTQHCSRSIAYFLRQLDDVSGTGKCDERPRQHQRHRRPRKSPCHSACCPTQLFTFTVRRRFLLLFPSSNLSRHNSQPGSELLYPSIDYTMGLNSSLVWYELKFQSNGVVKERSLEIQTTIRALQRHSPNFVQAIQDHQIMILVTTNLLPPFPSASSTYILAAATALNAILLRLASH
jgi:hypothetical protein